MKQIYYGILFALLVYLKLNENKTKKGNFRIAALVGIIYILYQLFQDSNIEGMPGKFSCSPSPLHCPLIEDPQQGSNLIGDGKKGVSSNWCPPEEQSGTGHCYIYSNEDENSGDYTEPYQCSGAPDALVDTWSYPDKQCQCGPSASPIKITKNWLTEFTGETYVCHDQNLFSGFYSDMWYIHIFVVLLCLSAAAFCFRYRRPWLLKASLSLIVIYFVVLVFGWVHGEASYKLDDHGYSRPWEDTRDILLPALFLLLFLLLIFEGGRVACSELIESKLWTKDQDSAAALARDGRAAAPKLPTEALKQLYKGGEALNELLAAQDMVIKVSE